MLNLISKLLRRKPAVIADERISYRKQEHDYDCGQTCLEMLGYSYAYALFPETTG